MKKNQTAIIGVGLKVGAGFIAGRLVSQIGPLKDNQILASGAQIAAGMVFGKQKGLGEIGIGMVASGVVSMVQNFVPSLMPAATASASGFLGLIPGSPVGSTTLPGVAGEMSYAPSGVYVE